ncbi:hypothetical protein Tco_0780561 [Tanacetum coccineum]
MANLKYFDKHNMVAFLKKPNESVGFTEVVDFFKGTSLRYALTYNPTLYDSLVKQFWQNAIVRTLANGTQQLVASIDSTKYTITEASVRRDIVPLLPAMLAGAVVGQAPLPEGNTSGSAEDSVQLKELMVLVPKLVNRIESMKEKPTDFVTPTKASGEAQEEEISPTILEASKTLSKVASQEVNTGIKEVSSGSTKVDSEQLRQEEAGLEEAIKLQAQLDEEVAKQIHLDKMVAQRMAEEEVLAKLETNAELSKDVLGKDLPEQDFSKRMVDMVNQRKKYFAEERAKAKRNKPMTQSQLRIYMSNYLKNQGTWKLSQLKKLKFEEIKEEFDKLVQQIDTFVPINLEATKAKLKRYGEELQTKTSKKQRIEDKDVLIIGEKVTEVKEEEQVKRTGKRKKQKARKGINVDKSAQEESETDKEELVEAMNPTPLTTKSDSVVNWKIFQQGQRSIYQIIRANGADTVYMSFGAMIKDFIREDLIELYRLVMQKYGTNRPEDVYDRVLWSDLRTMFDPPLTEDAI